MTEDKLELRYIPLSQARRWDENPKLHDLDALVRSIETHGFGDPPKFDARLQGLVYGNGRTEALERMHQEGRDVPRGILTLEDGEWAIPVIFGVDAVSKAAAVAFAIDHNHLTVLGGGAELEDVLGMWDQEALERIVSQAPDIADVMASFEAEDMSRFLQKLTGEPEPTSEPAGSDFDYREQFGVIVLCEDEAQQKEVYEKLQADGYQCRVAVV